MKIKSGKRERETKPNVKLFPMYGTQSTRIRIHETVMKECGFEIGDTVDLDVTNNMVTISGGTEFTIARFRKEGKAHGSFQFILPKQYNFTFANYSTGKGVLKFDLSEINKGDMPALQPEISTEGSV